MTSTIFGEDPQRGLVALCGLLLVAGLGYSISLRILVDPAPKQLIVRSVTFAAFVWLVFCVGGAIAWSHGVTRLQEEAATSFEVPVFAPTATLFWIPRLSGFCLDANRAGFILVMYMALRGSFRCQNALHALPSRCPPVLAFYRGIEISNALSCLHNLFSHGLWSAWQPHARPLGWPRLTIVCLLASLVYRKEIVTLAELWQFSDIVSDRLSSDPSGTAGSHIQLIQRGFATWTTSTRPCRRHRVCRIPLGS